MVSPLCTTPRATWVTSGDLSTNDLLYSQLPHLPQLLLRQVHRDRLERRAQCIPKLGHRRVGTCAILQYCIHSSVLPNIPRWAEFSSPWQDVGNHQILPFDTTWGYRV